MHCDYKAYIRSPACQRVHIVIIPGYDNRKSKEVVFVVQCLIWLVM